MNKRLISIIALLAYCGVLVKVMVFKSIPTIKIGQLMLNFGGTDAGHDPNFIPFVTIVPYLLGYKGLIIAGINIVGNIILLVPVGFLLPLVWKNIKWKQALILSVLSGLVIEILQVILRVGIFDIDDVILNALGSMIGYWSILLLVYWLNRKKYLNIFLSVLAIILVSLSVAYYVYPKDQPVVMPEVDGKVDLCGGTGGIGEIQSTATNTITIKLKNGRNQIVRFSDEVTIKASSGPAGEKDLKKGDRVTLVGDGQKDGSFRADTILVCAEVK